MAETATSAPRSYKPLEDYLQRRFADRIVLTFSQIEDLIGFLLPDAARATAAWWDSPAPLSAQSSSWTNAHRIATVNLTARCVLFERA